MRRRRCRPKTVCCRRYAGDTSRCGHVLAVDVEIFI
jgi:hypothetical protein